jgi:hypothetical protein
LEEIQTNKVEKKKKREEGKRMEQSANINGSWFKMLVIGGRETHGRETQQTEMGLGWGLVFVKALLLEMSGCAGDWCL